ncbi:unnamed protein product [Urochloa decumbens]|uniref:Late embryogenesis abundant protein LEA-2 subgroup domain-containing protein n=1 Tax=Urochloa decumbens TaxID=240449 RepID=A0ABC8Z5R4_9POAL
MGLGFDLDTAAAEPFNAMEADPHHAAASGGRRRRGCCSRASCYSPSAENDPCFLLVWTAAFMTVALFDLLVMIAVFKLVYREPSFSVELTGYDGIDPGRAPRIVSPAFNVTLRMNNTCVDSAHVAVTYSGVALGWARVDPRDCAEGRWTKDVEVVARGGRVGLSRRLRDRMASDWSSAGAVELDVNVLIYHHVGRRIGTQQIPRTFDGKVKMIKRITTYSRTVGL